MHTSGTTENPKGVLRDAGGHEVGLHLSISYLNIHGPEDVFFTASHIGWIVGDFYILYAPLLAEAATVQVLAARLLFEHHRVAYETTCHRNSNLEVLERQNSRLGFIGNIVLGLPLVPTAFRTLWAIEERFYKSYLRRIDRKSLDIGDAGWIDAEGYVYVMGRNDDVLNVSACRLSSGAIEQTISSHPLVAESCIVGTPDILKGQLPFAFIILSITDHPESDLPDNKIIFEIQSLVRNQIGAFPSLGGIVQCKGMIPKTRSGKTLRRALRELVENGVHGDFATEIAVPSTEEDAAVAKVARAKVKEDFEKSGGKHKAVEAE